LRSLIDYLLGPSQVAGPKAPLPAREVIIRSRYDAAQTGVENYKHWANADDLSADWANVPQVRRIIRRRARYERDNDPHLNGLMKIAAHDLVGTGPRLQINAPENAEESARMVEASFASWACAIGLAEKLRILHEVRPVDGESFAMLFNNPKSGHPIKLDLKLLESEQVATPSIDVFTPTLTDGIEFDDLGNPTVYHVLRQHPGDQVALMTMEYDRVPADQIAHWYRPTRPGQHRGVSEIASSLPIGAQTRRYSAAVLGAAELAANFAGVLETDMPPDQGQTPAIEDMDLIETSRQGLLTLPMGWKASQFDPKQPAAPYKEYIGDKRNEMGRPIIAPRNLVTGDSSQFNFASGRLDHLPYQRVVWIERERMRYRVLDRPIFYAWWREAANLGLIPDDLPAFNELVFDWHWDGFDSLNPIDDYTATQLALTLNLTTLSEACANRGLNWREVIDQRAVERSYMTARGLDPDAGMSTPPTQAPENQPAGARPGRNTAPADQPSDEQAPAGGEQ
jgi:capsid protein